ncbi:hypothetical protein [Magnetococcus sp. PR-3]
MTKAWFKNVLAVVAGLVVGGLLFKYMGDMPVIEDAADGFGN